jgi:tetratricopeptide (TPR) repeat protein
MSQITAHHYLLSWYEDPIHEYGYNQVDEYFVQYMDRGLIFNVNRQLNQGKKVQHCWFSQEPRNTYYVGFVNKVTAPLDETVLPLSLVQECYEIASLREKQEQMLAKLDLPQKTPMTHIEAKQEFSEALAKLKIRDYSSALKGFNRVLTSDPNNSECMYNIACVYSLQGDLDKAMEYLQQVIDIGKWSDILHIVTDEDLAPLMASGRRDVAIAVKEVYCNCISSNFRQSINGKRYVIDLPTYNLKFNSNYTEEHLALLTRYGIDITKDDRLR